MWGAFVSIFANIVISLGLAFQKAAHNELEALERLQQGSINSVPPTYTSLKTWWIGISFMITGEIGNFLAYGDTATPASIVAAVGCVGVISNYFISITWLKEPFRPRDILGCALVVAGVVMVIEWAPQKDVTLLPSVVQTFLLEPIFLGYFAVTVVIIAILYPVCAKYGDRHVLFYLSLCSLIGGYTPMSAKTVSSFIVLIFSSGEDDKIWVQNAELVFTSWKFYLMLAIMAGTAVVQVQILNKAMAHFGNTLVVPCYYVCFTLATIIGTGVLYQYFSDVDGAALIAFIFGIFFTSSGVSIITSGKGVSSMTVQNGGSALFSSSVAVLTDAEACAAVRRSTSGSIASLRDPIEVIDEEGLSHSWADNSLYSATLPPPEPTSVVESLESVVES